MGTRRRLPERVAAWAVTGPAGHLLAGMTDLGVLLWRLAVARVRARLGRASG